MPEQSGRTLRSMENSASASSCVSVATKQVVAQAAARIRSMALPLHRHQRHAAAVEFDGRSERRGQQKCSVTAKFPAPRSWRREIAPGRIAGGSESGRRKPINS